MVVPAPAPEDLPALAPAPASGVPVVHLPVNYTGGAALAPRAVERRTRTVAPRPQAGVAPAEPQPTTPRARVTDVARTPGTTSTRLNVAAAPRMGAEVSLLDAVLPAEVPGAGAGSWWDAGWMGTGFAALAAGLLLALRRRTRGQAEAEAAQA